MRFLSRFVDYYDYSCTYFSNETTYVRTVLAECNYDIVRYIGNNTASGLNCRDSMGREGEYSITFGHVIVANINYPFAKVTQTVKDIENSRVGYPTQTKRIHIGIFYTIDEIKQFYTNKWDLTYSYKRLETFFNTKLVLDLEHPIAIYDSNKVKLPAGVRPFNIESVNWEHGNELYQKLVYNACLKEYKFPIDGKFVLQEVEMFLNKHKDEKVNQITDDKVLLVAKGFDNNSFKKAKQ